MYEEEGKANGWPGLAKEVTDISDELGIPDLSNGIHVQQRHQKR